MAVNRPVLAKAAAVLLLASGVAGIVDLAWNSPPHLLRGGRMDAVSGLLLRIGFLAIGSHLLHAPVEAAGPLRCASLFVLGYLATGFGLFGALVLPNTNAGFGEMVADAVTGPSRTWAWNDGPLVWLSFSDGFGAVVFTIVPFLLPKPDRRSFLLASLFFAFGLSMRPWLYALHFRAP